MAYNNRYQYETSPRKIQPEYKPMVKKYPKKSTARKVNKKVSTKQQKKVKIEAKLIGYVLIGFAILFAISYRNSLINENFTKIKELKAELATIQKENEQLEANIESNLNLKTIEQSAKENLGMKKLDSSQTVYVSLPKTDYVEPAAEEIITESEDNWFQKIINVIMGK